MKKFWKNQAGFSLPELLCCVVIIALLVALSIPIYSTVRNQAKETAFDAQVRELRTAAELHLATGGGNAIWAPGAGAQAGDVVAGAHEAWYRWLPEWPENPLETGDFVVEIQDGKIFVSPGREE
ncbi:MAG: prepilin-type N-terminal cleavage/methylation domain-containing protein [Thermodesulfobacteriota bacterium]|nr:prepilin-type N-terminal cleavage/methylation domain-containing protein [Thermodesulfobacteriota bacterium]